MKRKVIKTIGVAGAVAAIFAIIRNASKKK